MSENRQQIVVEDVLDMLKDGKTREEIGNHYGLNGVEMKTLFSHPELKGKRTHKAPTFTIVTREQAQGNDIMHGSQENTERDMDSNPQMEMDTPSQESPVFEN